MTAIQALPNRPKTQPENDWATIASGLLGGECKATRELGRRVTGMLSGWHIHDFRCDWADLVQEVLIAVTLALREDKIRDASALSGYVRRIARNKLNDRLRRHCRRKEDEVVEWSAFENSSRSEAHAADACHETCLDIRRALAGLPQPVAALVYKVYGERKTYDLAAVETGVPLGTAKRQLRDGLRELRLRFGAEA